MSESISSASSVTSPAPTEKVQKRKKKKRSRLRILLIVVAAVLVAGLVALKFRGNPEQAIAVTTEKSSIRTITQVVTATGKIQPEDEVRISSEVAGELVEIPVREGQQVKKGDVLAKIQPSFYQTQVDQQEASLASARASASQSKARLAKATNDYDQALSLWSKKLISEAERITAVTSYEAAKAEHDASVAGIRKMEGSLNQVRDQIGKTVIYSPMNGTVSSLSCKTGERVLGTGQFAGTEIMRIADFGNMEVRTKVNENDIVNVKNGDSAVIAIDAFPSKQFSGKVYEISASAITSGISASGSNSSTGDEVTNFLVKIRISDTENRLRPGMSATADIKTQTVTNVISVPIQSVTVRSNEGKTTEDLRNEKNKQAQERSGNDLEVALEKEGARRDRERLKTVVFAKDGERVKQIRVETGIADNSYIEIKSGLKPDQEIVSGGYAAVSRKLKDGSLVTLEKPKTDLESDKKN